MPWAFVREEAAVGMVDLLADSPAIDVEVKVSDFRSWDACPGTGSLRRRRHDGLYAAVLVEK